MRRLFDGETYRSIVRETGVNEDALRLWKLRYEKYGEGGLESLPGQTGYPEEKRMAVVRDYYEKGLSLLQLSSFPRVMPMESFIRIGFSRQSG